MKHLLALRVPSEIIGSYLSNIANGIGVQIAIVVLPLLLAISIFSVATNVMQGGLAFSTESLGFHFEKLAPKGGWEGSFRRTVWLNSSKA